MDIEMMKHKTSLLVSTLLLTQFSAVNAADQPDAETLVGNYYGGVHGAYMKADNDRLDPSDNQFTRSGGIGVELGYRLSAPVELRLSYTRFAAELHEGDNIQGINKYSLDALYFPTEQNIYVLGGVNAFDFDTDTEAAVNAGLGYRQYFTDQFAGYLEGKANYQFEDKHTDAIAQVGLVYFFDTNEKVVAVKPEPAPYVAPAPVVVDTDKDGVVDGVDQCPATPTTDKVDEVGCTVFEQERLSYRLAVNFDNNKAVVKPEYYSELSDVAAFLKQYPHVDITVDGYTSVLGKASYNQQLSEKRAVAVANLLTSEYGIASSRVTPVGHGETNLIDSSNTAEAHKMNRRIEININETRKVAVER